MAGVNSCVGILQVRVCITMAAQRSHVVLLDEMMHKVIPERNQLAQLLCGVRMAFRASCDGRARPRPTSIGYIVTRHIGRTVCAQQHLDDTRRRRNFLR